MSSTWTWEVSRLVWSLHVLDVRPKVGPGRLHVLDLNVVPKVGRDTVRPRPGGGDVPPKVGRVIARPRLGVVPKVGRVTARPRLGRGDVPPKVGREIACPRLGRGVPPKVGLVTARPPSTWTWGRTTQGWYGVPSTLVVGPKVGLLLQHLQFGCWTEGR